LGEGSSHVISARRVRMRLPGRTVVITGGAAGIGATYSAGLVREGAVVYIAGVADGTSLPPN
jgi:NADP-dependent 3-hydroxy acid dehydrogenase YdfG